MINAHSEMDFLWRGLRAALGFRLAVWRNWLRNGHVVRRRLIRDYMAGHDVRKLHLGATFDVPGFLNSQIVGAAPIDITRPMPLPDGSFDLIYSSHLVEHVQRTEFLAFLRDCHRVLRPGGTLVIATPSIERVSRTLYGPDGEERRALVEHSRKFCDDGFVATAHQINLVMRAFGHRFLYDRDFMTKAGKAYGFSHVSVIDNVELPDEHLQDYVKNRKPLRWMVETETYEFRK